MTMTSKLEELLEHLEKGRSGDAGVAAAEVIKELTKAREEAVEEAAKVVMALKREVPYEYNSVPCSTTMKRASRAILALKERE